MVLLVLILGAVGIVAFFALIAFLILKFWIWIIDCNQRSDRKALRSVKKEGHAFLLSLLSKDYSAEKRDVIIRVIALAALLCIMILWAWFSAGTAYLQ